MVHYNEARTHSSLNKGRARHPAVTKLRSRDGLHCGDKCGGYRALDNRHKRRGRCFWALEVCPLDLDQRKQSFTCC